MRHKLILTKEQLDEICGSDSSYLDRLTSTPDIPENIYSNEVFTSDSVDGGYPVPVKTDDIEKSLSRETGMFGTGKAVNGGNPGSIYMESKRNWLLKNGIVQETNRDLKNQNITAVIGNDATGKQKITGNESMLAMRKSRALDSGDEETAKQIGKVLDGKRENIRQRKENLKNLGVSNQFQKAGGNKNSGNGKAHTKKGPTGIGKITYFN